MSYLEIWMDGDWHEESVAWKTQVGVDFELIQDDQELSILISNHIHRSLNHLGKEIEEIVLAWQKRKSDD